MNNLPSVKTISRNKLVFVATRLAPRQSADRHDAPIILSPRELEILNLLARGFRYAEIAAIAFISINTVQTHVKNIYRKLKTNSKNEAVYEAMQLNFISFVQ